MENKIQKLVLSMLMHNTGIAMGDSGGADGRHWQYNAKHDPRKQPEVWLDIPRDSYTLEQNGNFVRRGDTRAELMAYKGLSADEMEKEGYTIRYDQAKSDEIGITVSLYHYLPTVLELDHLCDEFNARRVSDWDSDIYGVSKSGAAWLAKHGLSVRDSWNTYNGECNLSQTLQGTNVADDPNGGGGDYVLLQIHGGADVRGGYTDAKLFKLQRFQEYIDPTPMVWGQIKRGEEIIPLQMRENGYGFERENPETGYGGDPVELLPTDIIEAGLIGR